MRLSICIPVFNNYNLTKSCLKDLSFLPNDHEIIIFDNNSADDTINLLDLPKDQLPKNFQYIRSDVNLGFSGGSNKSYNIADGEYILFLNNDIRVKNNYMYWTELLMNAAEDGSLVGPNGGLLDNDLNFIRETNKIEDGIFYMSGWCLCAKKEVFKKLIINDYPGPFTEEFKTYFEDTDMSLRAKQLNINMKVIPVPLIHLGRMTSKQVGLSGLYLSAKEKFKAKWTNKI